MRPAVRVILLLVVPQLTNSSDLDSMASAVLFAWFRSEDNPETSSFKKYIPLLNIPKEDIKLRPEFQTLFKICHIDAANLVTLTDLPTPEILPPEQTQWVLVDHNKLDSNLGQLYSSCVAGCIDHHNEENSVPKNTKTEPRIIEKCGSCTSLVLREVAAPLLDENADLDDKPKYGSDVLKLGLASILIDTHNLQDATKTRKVDQDVVTCIDRILSARSPDWNRDAFFGEIDAVMRNLDGLSFNDVLRKDYKQWTETDVKLGISSVVRDLDFLDGLVDKDQAIGANSGQYMTAVSEFMAKRELDIWAVMTIFSSKQKDGDKLFQRQLRLHWRSQQSRMLVEKFEERNREELQLESIKDTKLSPGAEQNWMTWRQNNVAASRKQVAPLIRNTVKQYSKI